MTGLSMVLRVRKQIDEMLHSRLHPSVLESRFVLERKQLPKPVLYPEATDLHEIEPAVFKISPEHTDGIHLFEPIKKLD